MDAKLILIDSAGRVRLWPVGSGSPVRGCTGGPAVVVVVEGAGLCLAAVCELPPQAEAMTVSATKQGIQRRRRIGAF